MNFKKNFWYNSNPIRILSLVLIALLISLASQATHNRAGEIVYQRIKGEKFKITIITFTEINHNNAERDTLELNFGDGTSAKVKRTTEQRGYGGYTDIARNTYTTEHEYPGPGKYKMSVLDPNRNGGIINIPNSIERKFYIESYLNITLGESNNSAILIRDPIAFACNNTLFYHNPGAFDPDGDSLVFSLVPCKADFGLPIPDYTYPSASKEFKIDPNTGIVTWDTPIAAGEYNIAILVTEYRTVITANGTKKTDSVGTILRDMQITVYSNCTNKPPEISPVDDYCVTAGDNLTFMVTANDLSDGSTQANGNVVKLEAFGGPMVVDPVAQFTTTGIDPVDGTFYWDPACNHVRKRPFLMTFEAKDNGRPELSNFTTSDILVVAPPVENVEAQAVSSSIELKWEREKCIEAIGYRIYRRSGPTGFIPDSCETGVPNYLGYTLIEETIDINKVDYIDDNGGKGLIPGVVYCYLIVAYFSDGAESYASEEVCARLKKDVPILTHVDDSITSLSDGIILVKWSKPTDHDTLVYPGPYKYRVLRTEKRKFDEFVIIDSTNGIDDTTYMDVGLNTEEIEYTYKIEMLDQSEEKDRSMGFSVLGTSIYLKTVAKDRRLILNWNELVPWDNKKYTIYKQNESGTFDSLATVTEQQYIDSNLINLKTYCYQVVSTGEYTLNSISKPLINRSQIHCNEPVDLQAPCPPEVSLFVEDCSSVQELIRSALENSDDISCFGNNSDQQDIVNMNTVELTFTNPNVHCDTTDDVDTIYVYFSPHKSGPFKVIHRETLYRSDPIQPSDYTLEHYRVNTRAGCYYVVALDENKNFSPVVDTVCVDNCLLYVLPNVFTPNDDGINDFFEPAPYCYVKKIELKIFNRWGNPVFETENPNIKWDGINSYTNNPAPEGVYYYTCRVHQITVEGTKEVELKGIVHILGSTQSPN